MLRHWTQSSKVSCLVITCAALPKNDDERFREDNKVGWSSRVLYKYAQALDIDMNYLLAYEPLVRHSYGLPNETLAMIDPFLSDLRSSGLALQYLMELYIFLVTSGFYDARGRVAVRNCVDILQLSREEYFALEVALARSLHDCEERLARAASAEINKDNTKLKRYLKIGAAGLGAGAVIALTGGLAAPAVAAALVVIGGSAAAAAAGFATFTVLASVFGTAGAGLAGYKMARRTKGIDEFEFEQFGEKGQLAVTIMVSGWMHESEDYKRTFGILPSAMTLEEALTRFYLQHDRGMLNSVKSETSAYEKSPMALVDQVTMKYGLCPLTPANLTTPYDPIALSERDQALLERLIADFVMTGRSRPFDGHWSSKDETDSDNATTKTKSSISNSAGRFFKGLMPGSASVPLPSEKNTKSQISSICQSEERDNANNTNINCAYDVTALKKPTLSRSQSITSGTPDVGVHLLESHQITEVSPVAEDRKCGITSEMEVGDPIAGYVDRSKDCRIGDHSNFRLSSNEMKSNDAKEGPELHYWYY